MSKKAFFFVFFNTIFKGIHFFFQTIFPCLSPPPSQDALQRQRAPPPTKEGNTGERIDTNTFVSKSGGGGGGRQYHSNGSLNHNNGSATFGGRGSTPGRTAQAAGAHSNPVRVRVQLTSGNPSVLQILIG